MSEDSLITMTPEIAAKMRRKAHFKPGDTFPYVPEFFRDPANEIPKPFWPVYILKSQDGIESAEEQDGAGYAEVVKGEAPRLRMESGKKRIATLEKGIKNFKNVRDEAGEVVSFRIDPNTNLIAKDLLRGMDPDLQIELQNAITDRSRLSAEELQGLEF